MKIIFWRKGRLVHVWVSSIDELLAHLRPDQEVVDLLQQKIDGVATQVDECYLEQKIRKERSAQDAYEAMKAMYPDRDLRIWCIRRMVKRACVAALLLVSAVGAIYAGLHYTGLLHRAPAVHQLPALHQPAVLPTFTNLDQGTYKARLDSLIDSAEIRYKRTIVIDEAEIAKLHGIASMDATIPLNDFLNNVTKTNGLEFHIDTARVIHIRKAAPTD
jgi:hypothetical protein